jgi:hypothetical protein
MINTFPRCPRFAIADFTGMAFATPFEEKQNLRQFVGEIVLFLNQKIPKS